MSLITEPRDAEQKMIDVALKLLQETKLSARDITGELMRRIEGDDVMLRSMALTGCSMIVFEAGLRYVDERAKAH